MQMNCSQVRKSYSKNGKAPKDLVEKFFNTEGQPDERSQEPRKTFHISLSIIKVHIN